MRTPVLIVGGGPVGSTLALDLASRGIAHANAQDILVKSFFLTALDDKKVRDYFLSLFF